MTKFTTISLLIAATFTLASIACTAPDPVVREVEVTREVPQTVEVAVEVPVEVTRLVERTVEVPVTEIVERTVEVTREVPVTVIVTATSLPRTPTPRPTATQRPTATPKPTATMRPTPRPTPTPVNLATTTKANMWVYLTNDGNYLKVLADTAFDADVYDLDVIVGGETFCNVHRMYGDEGAQELSCGILQIPHSRVSNVSVQTPIGDLRCARNRSSDSFESVFACAWR